MTGRLGRSDTTTRVVGLGAATLLVLFLGLPIAALLARAALGGVLPTAASSRVVADALALSLGTTAITLLLAIVLGGPLAFVLARRRFRGAALIEALIDLPIVLPPAVAGLALLLVLGRRG
ncbi:MAG TPA: hypothetical protein VGC90_11150, partial [Candidatus Limnocylindrales bacterium]